MKAACPSCHRRLPHIRAPKRVREPKPLRPLELEVLAVVERGPTTAREVARQVAGDDMRIWAAVGSLSLRRLLERGAGGTLRLTAKARDSAGNRLGN